MLEKPIPSFPRYRADVFGNIYSPFGRKLKQATSRGYPIVSIGGSKYVHRLILETFIGPRPKGKECRHLDSDKTNNNLRNLVWGTRLDNMRDRLEAGPYKSKTQPRGKRFANPV